MAKRNSIVQTNQFTTPPRSSARIRRLNITLDTLPPATHQRLDFNQISRNKGIDEFPDLRCSSRLSSNSGNCLVDSKNLIPEGKKSTRRDRKRGEEAEEVMEGWTKEQEVTLKRACDAANPTPHFWKNVSELVPGKSAQDCFDRVHPDQLTPSKHQSREKKIKSPYLKQFSLSPSKVLIPTMKRVKPNSRKQKNYLTRKYIEELENRCKVDQDHGEDLFSVLEPDVKFSSNALQPSAEQKEKQGLLQSCSGTSSSCHKKSLSTFSNSSSTDPPSPPVLKPVKNRVLHEKYIDKLRCRDARRRAASERAKKSTTKNPVNEETKVQKDAVKVARKALMSVARDAINRFQQSQAFMGSSYGSDDDDNDSIGIASADEDAEDENY